MCQIHPVLLVIVFFLCGFLSSSSEAAAAARPTVKTRPESHDKDTDSGEAKCYYPKEECEKQCQNWFYECEEHDISTRPFPGACCELNNGRVAGGVISLICAVLVTVGVLTCIVCFLVPKCPLYRGKKSGDDDDEVCVDSKPSLRASGGSVPRQPATPTPLLPRAPIKGL